MDVSKYWNETLSLQLKLSIARMVSRYWRDLISAAGLSTSRLGDKQELIWREWSKLWRYRLAKFNFLVSMYAILKQFLDRCFPWWMLRWRLVMLSSSTRTFSIAVTRTIVTGGAGPSSLHITGPPTIQFILITTLSTQNWRRCNPLLSVVHVWYCSYCLFYFKISLTPGRLVLTMQAKPC